MNHIMRKPVLWHTQTTGADQLAHLTSLISTFIVHNAYTCHIKNFQTLEVSVAEQAGLLHVPVESSSLLHHSIYL